MKKNLLYLFSLLLIVGGFAGCSRDEKCPVELPVDFAGVYKGVLDVELNGTQIAQGLAQKVYITSVDGKKATLALKNFSFGEMELGDIVVRDVDVKQPRGTVVFSGSDIVNLAVGECQVNLAGDIVDNKMTTDIDVDVKGQEMKVKVKFNGEKMAADQSSEAQISDFTIEGAEVAFDEATKTYNVTVTNATEEDLKEITPAIKISDKATIIPAIGTAIDLSEGKEVKYTVTSEDGVVVNEYKVKVAKEIKISKVDFEGDWLKKTSYYVPQLPESFWDSSDGGAALFLKGAMTVYKSQEGEGFNNTSAAVIQTQDGDVSLFLPKVVSGSLFSGVFKLNIPKPLLSTQFGIPYSSKPSVVKGVYKYKSGEIYYECPDPSKNREVNIVEGKDDNYAMTAVLYTVTDDKETLDGTNLNSFLGENIDERVVAYAYKSGGNEESFKEFTLDLKYVKEYDAEKKYKFAIVFSSSKDGDKFSGAPGSTLLIDNVEIIAEN